jgi:carboxymethylenebutenolidase
VTRFDVEINTPDGTCPASVHMPEGDGPWPGVLLFPDAAGLRETKRMMADRLAGMGYVTLVPDVYHREGEWTPFDVTTLFTDPDERARMGSYMSKLTPERIASDSGACLDFLLARPEVAGTAAGTTGYCMGGRLSLITAAAHPDKVAASASFHGGRIAVADDPESPHLAADRIAATVYVAGAEDDDHFTPEQAQLLDTALTEAGVRHTVEFYPAKHGFAVPDNPTYDSAAEERHWKALETLYGSTLQA